MAFYFKLGFGRDVGLSLYLDLGGTLGGTFGFCFLGGGDCLFKIGFCLAVGLVLL